MVFTQALKEEGEGDALATPGMSQVPSQSNPYIFSLLKCSNSLVKTNKTRLIHIKYWWFLMSCKHYLSDPVFEMFNVFKKHERISKSI